MPKGHWVVEYTVRLNNPGTFLLPATRVEAMFAPEMLGADVGMPVLNLTRHSFATDGKPVEFARSVYRGDRYKFVTTLLP